jgi:uncharacterized membrane protein YfcA
VGTFVGLTGVGGGSLMRPVLIFFFGVKPFRAVGTDLQFAAFTKTGGTIKMARSRHIDWPVVLNLSAGSIPAALFTLYVLHKLGDTSAAVQHIMTTTLGCALLLAAAADHEAAAARPRHWSLPLLFGALKGTLVTLTSVGAGAIGVTVLMLLYPLLPLPRIVAADIAYVVPLTLVAGMGHASLGSLGWPLLAMLLAGSLPGIGWGSYLMHKTPRRPSGAYSRCWSLKPA